MNSKRLLSYTRRAVDDYCMIDAGDKIAVGISGGKDSLTLLYALHKLQKFYPKPFDLIAMTVHMGFESFQVEPLYGFCERLHVPYEVIHTDIAEIVFQVKKLKNPCSLCAKLRKGAFNRAALASGCNKIAYAHNMDDLIETMLLSMLYEGRFHSFSPKTYLERTGLTLIRPLMYVPEVQVTGFQHKHELPVVKNPCPADGHTKRQYAKELLQQLNKDNPNVKGRIFQAIQSANIEDWPQKQR